MAGGGAPPGRGALDPASTATRSYPRPVRTVWVFGDQLSHQVGPLAEADPATTRVLLVESEALLRSRRWHRQRLHLVLAGMRRFAGELEELGFAVDHRRAPTMADGLAEHRRRHRPEAVVAMSPRSPGSVALLDRLGVQRTPNAQHLVTPEQFADWADGRARLRMEDFYRWQRRRLGYLMDGDEPVSGRWNHDADNREPPPTDGRSWPRPPRSRLDDLDRQVLADVERYDVVGEPPAATAAWWPTSRRAALARLRHVVDEVLPVFGPHEDAMLTDQWHLAHTLLSPALNLGMVHPAEVADAVEDGYRAGGVPIASAEGLLRQVIGWREYVWGLSWWWGEAYLDRNELGAHRHLPPLFDLAAIDAGAPPATDMACVATAVRGVHERGWVHHIQRLMVLGNLALLAGVEPRHLTDWMWASFVDGAGWVMGPNVVGMALHADGGRMATKPYAAGGAYINRMSDSCAGCRYDPRRRTGEDACPFTTLYWDFLARHRDRFADNHRMGNQLAGLRRLADLDDVRARAVDVLGRLDAGEL